MRMTYRSPLLGLEETGAIAEPAIPIREPHHPASGAVESLDADDRLTHLLPVRADVLNRRRTRRAGNAGETLDASPAARDGERHELIPRLAGGALLTFTAPGSSSMTVIPRRAILTTSPVVAAIGNEQVAARRRAEGGGWPLV